VKTAAPVLVSLQEAAAIIGIPATSIRDLHFRGVLPVVRFPGTRRWWIKRADLDNLIEKSLEVGR
jgi:excisionase family DNA binding protein